MMLPKVRQRVYGKQSFLGTLMNGVKEINPEYSSQYILFQKFYFVVYFV